MPFAPSSVLAPSSKARLLAPSPESKSIGTGHCWVLFLLLIIIFLDRTQLLGGDFRDFRTELQARLNGVLAVVCGLCAAYHVKSVSGFTLVISREPMKDVQRVAD